MTDLGLKYVAVAMAMLPLVGVAFALGNIFSTWLSSIARNPGAQEPMQQVGLLGFALTEAIALFALIIVLILLFVV
jgi:F-type H+-transporting ATPase subunit c